ncbi:MAG: EAL domain-containing protein [Steroidobacteraceae bacterium]|jgi:EAL domain-containing protein (putative c-di-GMP-specific phosphodiesterase class I)
MLEGAKKRPASDSSAFDSYVHLAKGLIGELSAVCLVDGRRRVCGLQGDAGAPEIVKLLDDLRWNGPNTRLASLICAAPGQWLTAIPVEQTDSTLLGIFCVQQALPHGPTQLNRHAADIASRLKPLLECIYRDLVAALPSRERVQTLTERTAQLEWLSQVTGNLQEASGDQGAIEQLLAAAVKRLGSALGVLEIPDKRLCIEHFAESAAPEGGWNHGETLRGVWQQTRRNLCNWVQLRNRPLVVGSGGRAGDTAPRCKILAVPAVRESGRVIGFLAFYNPPSAQDFSSGDIYLARHLGRQATHLIDSQFDLMTGLYTSGGLAQAHRALHVQASDQSGSLIYINIDRMQGRGCDPMVVAASEDPRAAPRDAAAVAVGRLRAALKSDRLVLHAERIEALQDSSLPCGYQISLRLRAADGSAAPLGALLATAERYQLWSSIDRWVVKNALQAFAPYRNMLQQTGIRLSLNVSEQSLADAAFGEYLLDQMKAVQLPAGCIMLILGAEAVVKNFAQASALIERLRAQGCRFELDGFGQGTHTLDYIKSLRISRVQIGANLVKGVAATGNAAAAVSAIVELAAGWSVETVATGVESAEQRRSLRELGVDFALGATVGESEPLAELLRQLGANEAQRVSQLYLEM